MAHIKTQKIVKRTEDIRDQYRSYHIKGKYPNLLFHSNMNLVFDPGFLACIITMTYGNFIREVLINVKIFPGIRHMFCSLSSLLPVPVRMMMMMVTSGDLHSLHNENKCGEIRILYS